MRLSSINALGQGNWRLGEVGIPTVRFYLMLNLDVGQEEAEGMMIRDQIYRWWVSEFRLENLEWKVVLHSYFGVMV